MAGSKMYVAHFEVAPRPGEAIFDGASGAFGRAYVAADSMEEAMQRVKLAIVDLGGVVVDFIWFANEDETESEFPDSVEAAMAIAEAATSGNVVFAPFHAWVEE